MVSLESSLQDEDLGRLMILAELWGIDAEGTKENLLPTLLESMLDEDLLLEVVQALPPSALDALNAILHRDPPMPFADFNRDYGPLREMGPGRRDREKPWRSPVSPLEQLWYRGLIARTFMDTPQGLMEFVVIPADLASRLPLAAIRRMPVPGNPSASPVQPVPHTNHILEDLTTLLAYLRTYPDIPLNPLPDDLARHIIHPGTISFLLALLEDIGILSSSPLHVIPERVKPFLEAPEQEIQHRLVQAWRKSRRWNDLAHVPDLIYPEDAWPNDPLVSREEILSFLMSIPTGEWWDLASINKAVRTSRPSFQRPGGDFDSWYVQSRDTGQFLRGFEHWDNVEGALIRFMITGPLVWLGLVETGINTSDPDTVTSIRLLPAIALLESAPSEDKADGEPVASLVKSNGEIIVPEGTRAHTRYQVARLAQWESHDHRGYHYQITPSSLERAIQQGLELRHILSILTMAAVDTIPPSLSTALKRWDAQGQEARMEQVLIVRVTHPDILDALRDARATSRYIIERLSPTTAIIPASAHMAFIQAAADERILVEPLPQNENSA